MKKATAPRFTVSLKIGNTDAAWRAPNEETIRHFVIRVVARARHMVEAKICDSLSLGHEGLSIAATVMIRFRMSEMELEIPVTVGELITMAERHDSRIKEPERESPREPFAYFRN